MKTKLLSALLSISIALSGVVGVASYVQADNNEYSYSFYNTEPSDHTTPRSKTTDRSVYVYAKSGPTLKYTVEGATSGGLWHTRSLQKKITSGHTARIENSVRDHGETRARLELVRTTTADTYSKGVWNPDKP